MQKDFYDVVVIGGGPAGLTAALYLARAKYRVIVLEKSNWGGQITITSEVVNYPGVERTSGSQLTETMRIQAQNFGAEFRLCEVRRLEVADDIKVVHTNRGVLQCFGILIATGAHPRMVGFEGETQFRGHGVAYCATCDGEFFTGKDVFVIGGGFSAAEESIFLTKYAHHVTILMRGHDFSCAKTIAEAVRNHEKITVLTRTQVEQVSGDTVLRYLRYRNRDTGEATEYRPPEGDTFGVFVFAGYEPATELLNGLVELDPQGYVLTDSKQSTGIAGVYAAGDVCAKNLRQVVTAVGDGACAATELERYASQMQEKTHIYPRSPALPKSDTHMEAAPTSPLSNELFSKEIADQLYHIFAHLQKPLTLQIGLDNRPISTELRQYMEALAAFSQKITVTEAASSDEDLPYVRILQSDGTDTGLAFHGVPGGHEFTSFVLGLYNASGPGQPIAQELVERIARIRTPVKMKILVSLSCTMCPELVVAAQHIAAQNDHITADVYDLNHFFALKERYQVMSVPCLVMNDTIVSFGKKDMGQILDLIETSFL